MSKKIDSAEIINRVSEGDPAAREICQMILSKGSEIDPDNFWGSVGQLEELLAYGISGEKVYDFFLFVCNRDISMMLAVMRADQMGQLAGVTKQRIMDAVNNRGKGIRTRLWAVQQAVHRQLPNFKFQQKYEHERPVRKAG